MSLLVFFLCIRNCFHHGHSFNQSFCYCQFLTTTVLLTNCTLIFENQLSLFSNTSLPLFHAFSGVESSIRLMNQSLTGLYMRKRREMKAKKKRENTLLKSAILDLMLVLSHTRITRDFFGFQFPVSRALFKLGRLGRGCNFFSFNSLSSK